MLVNRNELNWLTLQNPFSKIAKQTISISEADGNLDTSEMITSHVSCRRADIAKIIMNEQSAIFLLGTPGIGKSTLIRYLQRSPQSDWSWRNELVDLQAQINLNNIHFVQIDLTPLEGIESGDELLSSFVKQCILALQQIYKQDKHLMASDLDLKELRGLLRTISREMPDVRFFVMLDSLERLASPGLRSGLLNKSKAQTPHERGLALLDRCGVIRTLVDLIDEFTNFGVLLSFESLPRPKIDEQFRYVSLDLARFTTMTLQVFTWEDTAKFLAQEPENFGANWAKMFKVLGGNYIFSKSEQAWLCQQAGTHPYLIQQLCLQTFRFKQEYASIHKIWPELQERNKTQLIESINESLSTFLAPIWQRLEEALEKSSQETKGKFYEFFKSLAHKQAADKIDPTFWDELVPELRYILYSEGIVRYDRLQPVHYPGSILSRYLTQKAEEKREINVWTISPLPTTGRNLTISRSGYQPVTVSLSELEYRLLKNLIQHPERCNESELMKAAWGTLIERSRFTQRMHQLRKKLRDQSAGTEIIENSYGGFYSLNHPEWLQLK